MMSDTVRKLAKERKQKRWYVFSKAHNVDDEDPSSKTVKIYTTVYGKGEYNEATKQYNYFTLNSSSNPAYFLEFTDESFDKCKEFALKLMKLIGTENVIIVQNVDTETVLYPIE